MFKFTAKDKSLSEVFLEAENALRCISCGVEECVFSLDDMPIDETFAANYLCFDCEEVATNMQTAARSSYSSAPTSEHGGPMKSFNS